MSKSSSFPFKSALGGLAIIAAIIFGVSVFFPDFRYQVLDPIVGGGNSSMSRTKLMTAGSVAPAMEMAAYDTDEANFASFNAREESIILPPEPVPDGIEPDAAERMLIRTGNVSLIVEDVEAAIKTIMSATEGEWNGFVAESSMNDFSEDSRSGWMRLRIPADRFLDFVEYVKTLADRVESENVRVDDVTHQVVDTEARLKNMLAEEAQYLEILNQAETVEETLEVTRELSRVRGQIERTEAQLKNLGEEIAYSTLHVSLTDEGDVEVFGIYWKPLVQAKQALRGALENITGSIDSLLVFVFNIPLILVWLLILSLVGKYGYKAGRYLWKTFKP